MCRPYIHCYHGNIGTFYSVDASCVFADIISLLSAGTFDARSHHCQYPQASPPRPPQHTISPRISRRRSLNSLYVVFVRATNIVQCYTLYTIYHIDMLLSRSWIDSIILIGVCCPMFSSNDKRKKTSDTSNVFNLSSSPEEQHRQKEIQYVCVAGYFTRRSIITIDMTERKNHKMVYWERKNRVHIAESSMIEKRGAQMENWFDIVWHRKKRKKTIQSRIHSFVM